MTGLRAHGPASVGMHLWVGRSQLRALIWWQVNDRQWQVHQAQARENAPTATPTTEDCSTKKNGRQAEEEWKDGRQNFSSEQLL